MKQGLSLSIALGIVQILLLCTPSLCSANTIPARPKYTVSPKLYQSKGNETGSVKIEAKINRFGQVTSARLVDATNEVLAQACLDAIVHWKFEPAKRKGESISSTIIQPFEFNPGTVSLSSKRDDFTQTPRAYKRVSPKMDDRYANINGSLSFRVNLDSEGHIKNIALKETTHKELVGPTRLALEKWKFSPAMEQGEAVPSKVLVPFNFVPNPGTRQKTVKKALALNKVDTEPKLVAKHEPVLPVALERAQGEAWLLLYIDEYGYVAQADTLKSSSKEMSRLASKAVSQWKYKPATKNGRPVASKLAVPFRSRGGLLVAQQQADKNPKPIQKKSPKLPTNLSHINGYVRVLLELDEKGNVVTASAKESSHAELDGPAIEAAEKWKFRPAQKDGKPVASTLILPFVFGKS